MTISIPQKAATTQTVRRHYVADAGRSMDRYAVEEDRTHALTPCEAEHARDGGKGRRTYLRLCARPIKLVVACTPMQVVPDAPHWPPCLQTNQATTQMQPNLGIGSVAFARPHSLTRSI